MTQVHGGSRQEASSRVRDGAGAVTSSGQVAGLDIASACRVPNELITGQRNLCATCGAGTSNNSPTMRC